MTAQPKLEDSIFRWFTAMAPSLLMAFMVFANPVSAGPLPKPTNDPAYEKAKRELTRANDEQSQELVLWLQSDQPYLRQLALLRYLAVPELLNEASIAPLLATLDDSEPRPEGSCVDVVFRGAPMGEGQYENYAWCNRTKRSNAALAVEVLPQLVRQQSLREEICQQTIRTVKIKPQHSNLLSDAVLASCNHQTVLQAVATSTTPAAADALLVLFLGFQVDRPSTELSHVMTLLTATDDKTSGLAALVVVQDQHPTVKQTKAQQDAIKLVIRQIADDHNSIVLDLPLIRSASAPFGQALLQRLKRPTADNQAATIRALAASGKLPPGGVKVFSNILQSNAHEVALHAVTLLDTVEARRLLPAIIRAVRDHRRMDMMTAMRAVQRATDKIAKSDFATLTQAYRRSCRSQSVSYHDEPNEAWCADFAESLTQFAASSGFRFNE
jgi:hypothetical protein